MGEPNSGTLDAGTNNLRTREISGGNNLWDAWRPTPQREKTEVEQAKTSETNLRGDRLGDENEPQLLDLSESPYATSESLKSRGNNSQFNPALETWRTSDSTNILLSNESNYSRASEAQERLDMMLGNMPPSERQLWRDFQIKLSGAGGPVEADRIRNERDQAFPQLSPVLNSARNYLRHAQTDTMLTKAFPDAKDNPEFRKFLLTADLNTKETLVQIMDKPPAERIELFGKKQNLNYYNSDSGRANLLYGGNENNGPFAGLTKLSPDGRLLFQPQKTVDTTGDALLTPTLTAQSPENYGKKLSLSIQPAQEPSVFQVPKFPGLEPLRRAEPIDFLGNIQRDNKLGRLTVKTDDPLQQRLNQIDRPDHTAQLALKFERLEERLLEAFGKPDLKDLVDQKRFKETLATMRDSDRVSSEQKLDFVNSLERLTDPKAKAVAPLRDRNILAGQMLDQFANRVGIDQGDFGTCALSGVEKLMYGHDVETVARVITDVALTGKTVDARGRETAVDRDSLVCGSDIRRTVPPTDGVRSLASQYFAMISGNVATQLQNDTNKTNYRFAHENGRDLIKDDSTNPPGNVYQLKGKYLTVAPSKREPVGSWPVNSPGISKVETVLDTYEAMTGKSGAGRMLAAESADCTDPRAITVSSAKEMKEQLTKLGPKDFPIMFRQPGHVATVDGYNSATGLADYDNQWGDVNDHIGKNGASPEVLFKIATGTSLLESREPNELVSDNLEKSRNPELAKFGWYELKSQLAQVITDDTKISEACELAQELKLRADQYLPASKRVEGNSRVQNLQERSNTRTGERQPDSLSPFRKASISRHFHSLSDQIETRMTLASLSDKAGKHGDAEKNLLEAKKLADDLPLDLIEKQRLNLGREATKLQEPDKYKAEQDFFGDRRAVPTSRGLAFQQLNTRLALLDLYSGLGTTGVLEPEKAASMATEVRDTYQKMTGFDLMSVPVEPPAVMPDGKGQAKPNEAGAAKKTTTRRSEDPNLQLMRRVMAIKVRDAYKGNAPYNAEATGNEFDWDWGRTQER